MILANYCRSCGGGANFGDQLTPALFRAWGIGFEWAPPATATLFGIGSIVSKVPRGFTGTVWGSGTIRPGVGRDLRRARVLAVRGELTRAECRLPRGTPLGDPGVLAGDLLDISRQTSDVGGIVVVPHYVDHDLPGRWPGADVVPITTPPADFVGRIAGRDRVVTSSLHALIAADALGVPHVLEPHESVIGGLHKFDDYASALGETIRPGVERLSSRPAMAALIAVQRRIAERLRSEAGRGA